MDEDGQFLGAYLLSSVPEYKQHCVYHVGLPAPVRSDYARESLLEWTDDLLARVRLEVLSLDVCDQ